MFTRTQGKELPCCRGVVHPWDAAWTSVRICKCLLGGFCSQKRLGAKGQPWGELDVKLPPSLIAGEWETGEESLKSHVEKKGQLEDELFCPRVAPASA